MAARVYEVRAAGVVTAYLGESFREADEVYTRCKVSAIFAQRDSGVPIVLKSKVQDKYPGAFEHAISKLNLTVSF